MMLRRHGASHSALGVESRGAGTLSFLVANALTLSRWQFATTTLYHFTFVPLTLGLAPLLAIMQTLYYRTHDEKWNRLVRFFAVLFLINFAIGAATGLVQEFEFGMNWSSFSKYVGDVFGAPLAIEGLGAFMLESTFIGLWIFGREQLSPRVHLATIYMVWLGTWLSAYFIIVANSWMQHPVGYSINKSTGAAQTNDIATIMFQKFAIFAYVHVILAGCLTGGFVMLGVSAYHLRKGRNVDAFRAAAKLAIILMIPLTAFQLWWGNAFGIQTTNAQPMKIAATEALWNTQQPASFSLFQIGGFTTSDQTPSYSLEIPGLLSYLATGSFQGKVVGLNQNQAQEAAKHGSGNYMPQVELEYWCMRVMAYLGGLMLLVALWGGWLLWRKKLEQAKWFHRAAMGAIAAPFLACFGGWILTETGRQPWIVYGLQKTADAVSPTSTTTKVAFSLGVFLALYTGLAIVDFWLMNRYARLDPPDTDGNGEGTAPVPAPSY
jgi:cytochrome bd ubiquinol oxidase subunit I